VLIVETHLPIIPNSRKSEMREAIEDVEIGFLQLEFAIKLLSFCELGGIDAAKFDTDHLVQLKTGNLHFPSRHFQDTESLIRAASINVVTVFGVTTLVLDQAFEAIGMTPNPSATDADGQLRLLVYMVRCAHAHRIADPRWEVRGKYVRVLTVTADGVTIQLDLRDLNGQPFDLDKIGGYENWFRIRNAAQRLFSVACAA
jgi:hypothetical protein